MDFGVGDETHNRNCMQTLEKANLLVFQSTAFSIQNVTFPFTIMRYKKFHYPNQIPVKKVFLMLTIVHDCNNFVRLQGFFL